ncbi:MAG: helix-turn-helix domain-containing protein [Clostridia bacterium]|nr:helix-turn-helix domain-containing protein [Clostridia bacterium]
MKQISLTVLAESIKNGRIEKGYTQEQLSALTGINRITIGRIEREEFTPSIEQLEKLSDILEFDICDLFVDNNPTVHSGFGVSTWDSLFLSQSYFDCWDDYERSISQSSFPQWDYVVLTASNENQAEGYRKQIEVREEFLPKKTKFVVIPDEGGKRVGSGGATLSVLKYIHEKEGKFDGLKILVIHSGGDSKRVPMYSALGKLFSPVPHELPDGRSSTLFDEFLLCMASVPSRIREGMVLLSGDVLLLFNPLQIDYSGNGAAAISFKEDVETGKNHGVFLNGENNEVKAFLHKQTVKTLKDKGAVNDRNCVDIDTGAVIFSTDMLSSLYSLIDTNEKYCDMVNDTVRLSLYGDFLYPLALDSTLEQYHKEKPEGNYCDELTVAREKVWNVLRQYRLKLLRLAPAKFIHFGTTREILNLMTGGVEGYKDLGWNGRIKSSISSRAAGYNSILSDKAIIGDGCYLEVSYIHRSATVGRGSVLSYVDIHDETIPQNVVLHGLKQKNSSFIARIYGVLDNPKEDKLFGEKIEDVISELGIRKLDIWKDSNHTLWNADIYPECSTISEAIGESLKVYEMFTEKKKSLVKEWKNKTRKSLCSGFNDADPDAIIAWNKRMQELVLMDEITKAIDNKVPVSKLKKLPKMTKIQEEWYKNHLSKANFEEKIRLQYYVGVACGNDGLISDCFDTISKTILKATISDLKYNDTVVMSKDKQVINLPLRVNWGGGWSDTPPYCNEHGGTVLNAAIKLDGKCPVEVTIERIPEKKIIFDSRDMDVHGEFDTIEPLQRTGDPFDPFALQKAALLACGIVPKSGHSLDEILTRMGGGFVMKSEVTNVPKGSGLGTSSILSAACVKCIFEFFNFDYTEDDLYSHVLAMEQIMSTGGGWQDQVGGVTDGVKYITSMPGINQDIKVEHVRLSSKTKKELSDRFVLIYTGQRRLARNLLRDVVGRYVGNEPDSLFSLNEIQKIAVLMRFELERGNVDEFASLLNRHWELSKMVDAGSTNTLIDQIFNSIDDLIDGKLVCGAGGGGFLQAVLKKGVSKNDVHTRLKQVFQDNPVDIWPCELVW